MNRRDLLKSIGLAGATACIPSSLLAGELYTSRKTPLAPSLFAEKAGDELVYKKFFGTPENQFSFCLNTSTISVESLTEKIDIAAKAGYKGIELWIRDVQAHVESGKSLSELKKYITGKGLRVENAIGFAKCFVNDDNVRREALEQVKKEMDMMAQLECKRIAAPPAGVTKDAMPDLQEMGKRYKALIEIGRTTGVMPQLEFWGASGTLFQLGQALMVAAAANDPDVRVLADVYHLFRGDSGFEGLKMLNGSVIEIFHMNDYPAGIPREEQKDSDRVFPGDGAAPIKQILTDLKNMGGNKVLSLELFNPGYWKQKQLEVAKTGLMKMKGAVAAL